MAFEFDVLLSEILKTQQQTLQAIQTLASAIGRLPVTAFQPAAAVPTTVQTSTGGQAVDLTPLVQAIRALAAVPETLPTLPLQQVSAGEDLLAQNFSVPANGTINLTVRISQGATGASVQFSHDGGATWGALNAAAGGALSPGSEYTFSIFVKQGESVQVSMSAQTSLDVLDVFFAAAQVAGGA